MNKIHRLGILLSRVHVATKLPYYYVTRPADTAACNDLNSEAAVYI
jgi:hypothetical protein